MSTPYQEFDAGLAAAVLATPSTIPVVVGPCGSGRSTQLRRLQRTFPAGGCQYVALDRAVSTPERFLAEVTARSPFEWPRHDAAPSSPREAFEWLMDYLATARTASGGPATFLLDEFLEFQTFEHFPGLRGVVPMTIAGLARSSNRFVLTTRFVSRMLDCLKDAPDRFTVMHVPRLSAPDVAADLLALPGFRSDSAEETARVIVALTGGRPGYVADLLAMLADPGDRVPDALSVFVAQMTPAGAIARRCRQSYELRLHRARGYGALKAVLGFLSEDEPASLTEVALRMQRTPGSTGDYLSWLSDVDLVACQRKRYTVADPVMRLWIMLHTQCEPPDEARVVDLAQRYALARLSAMEASS